MKNRLSARRLPLSPDFGQKLQIYLHHVLEAVLNQEPLPEPTHSRYRQQLRSQKQALETYLSLLNAPLGHLSHFENTQPLKELCRPLYQRLAELQKAEEISELYQSLLVELPEMILAVRSLTTHLRFRPHAERVVASQTELESWYQRCNQLANQLDRLERSSWPIQSLENGYVDLILQVGEL